MITVYALAHPRTLRVRYIGRTLDCQRRLHAHLAQSRQTRRRPENRRLSAWIRRITAAGLKPLMIPIERCSELRFAAVERKWIALYRATGRLLNVMAGDKDGQPIRRRSETWMNFERRKARNRHILAAEVLEKGKKGR